MQTDVKLDFSFIERCLKNQHIDELNFLIPAKKHLHIIFDKEVFTHKQTTVYLRELLVIAMTASIYNERYLEKLKEELKKAYRRILENHTDESLLSNTYSLFLSELLNLDKCDYRINQSDSGAIYEKRSHGTSHIADLDVAIEVALLWVYFSQLSKSFDYLEASVKFSVWLCDFFDTNHSLHLGLYTREKEHIKSEVSTIAYLFFQSIKKVFSKASYELLIKPFLEKNFQSRFSSVFLLYSLWNEKTLQTLESATLELSDLLQKNKENRGFSKIHLQEKGLSLLLGLQGMNTGVGSVHLDELKIVTMGPQILPLGRSGNFGIYTTIECQKQTKIDENGVKGIVRLSLFDQRSYQHPFHWAEISLSYANSKFNFFTHLLSFEGREKVIFTFYIKALDCKIDDYKHLASNDLSKYEGEVKEIAFFDKNSSLDFSFLQKPKAVTIVPLGNSTSFWQASYLVACHFQEKAPKLQGEIVFNRRLLE